jgi:hypothetical protein
VAESEEPEPAPEGPEPTPAEPDVATANDS